MSASSQTVSRWPLLLALAMLLAAFGTLLWLRARLQESQQDVLDGTVRRFEATGVLGRPESNAILFEEVETLAAASQSDIIHRLYVTKLLLDGEEVTVLPFYAGLTDPDWRNDGNWMRLPVGEEPAGYLYIQADNSGLRAVTIGITLLGAILAAGLGALLIRTRGKEVQVSRLQSELEDRKVQILQLERLALAGQLSANIFHDIKKPVLNIKHEVTDALDEETPAAAEVLRSVKAQTGLFLQMLRELGMEAFVNASPQEHEWCDLQEAVEKSLRLVQYERGAVDVETGFAPGTEFLIQGFPHRLVQLFSNLFLNTYQIMDGSGKLRIDGRLEKNNFIITIEDSGPGIPPSRREQIFAPFATTRAQFGGSGLGLFICKTIVEDLNGTITVSQSPKLGGAQFTITLPAEET